MDKWVVHKFGGSSVADASCFRRVADILEASTNPREAVVLSACRGVTDALLGLVTLAEQPDGYIASAIEQMKRRHEELAAELLSRSAYEAYRALLNKDCRDIAGVLQTVRLIRAATDSMRDVISGYGEIWSTRLFASFLRERGRIPGEVLWIDARQVVVVEWGPLGPAVQWSASERNLRQLVSKDFQGRLIVTGFVATTTTGIQTTLGRNGSDFSGSIFGALLDASEIIIWTDVDGVLSADPRLVPNAQVIDQLSYNEAMELAYFGAKVIHPQTMEPAVARDIPIYIRNTFAPQKHGTLICAHPVSALKVKGITTIDPVALVNLEGAGMIGVPGTAHRLFGALRDAGISVILISQGSSEHSICFAIPQAQAQHHIHLRIAVVVLQPVDDAPQAILVLEQRRDVVEEDAGLGKAGHLANQCLEICHTEPTRIVTRMRARVQPPCGEFHTITHWTYLQARVSPAGFKGTIRATRSMTFLFCPAFFRS